MRVGKGIYFALFRKDAIQIMTVYEVKEGRV